MFVSMSLTGRTQGSAVYISSTATVSRHGGVKGRGGEDVYNRVCEIRAGLERFKMKC